VPAPKDRRPAPKQRRIVPRDRRIVAALALTAILVALLVGVAIAQGIGNPSVSSDEVAVVEEAPDGEVTTAEFERALEQTAALQGAREVPPPDDPQYATLRDSAMSDVLTGLWVRGEASDRGITLSESEISNGLDQLVEQQFSGQQKQFQRFLKQAHFTPEEARQRVELQLLGAELEKQVIPAEPSVSESDIEDFYKANVAQYEQPETRDVREIVNRDQAKVERAKALLERDDSPKSWKKVAARFSTDKTTKDTGGLRAGVAQGQSDPARDEQIFAAAEGQLVGPFEGQSEGQPGYYLIQVEKINPAETTPLSEASEAIGQQLAQAKQQQLGQSFQQDFLEKWRSRTFCADDYLIDRCDNFTPSVLRPPGAPPVISTPAVPPGRAAVFPGQPIPALPQGPISATAGQPGIIGPPGQALPPGTVPPGGAPPPTPTP
jgi:parvulin-like peptidyl-prolyl isomerase